MHSPRSDAATGPGDSSSDAAIPEVAAEGAEIGVEIDVQTMQLTLRASHPQALPTDVARHEDTISVFGRVAMQACIVETTSLMTRYRLVGRSHDLAWWPTPGSDLPALELCVPAPIPLHMPARPLFTLFFARTSLPNF